MMERMCNWEIESIRNTSLEQLLPILLWDQGSRIFQDALASFLTTGTLSKHVQTTVAQYLAKSSHYHPFDPSRYVTYYEDIPRSIFFDIAINFLEKGCLNRSERVRQILTTPKDCTIGVLLDTLSQEQDILLEWLSGSKKRRLQRDFSVLRDEIDAPNAELHSVFTWFYDLLQNTKLPSEKSSSSQKNYSRYKITEWLYIESSFPFYSLPDIYPSSRYFPAPKRDSRSVLDRSMGWHAPIGNTYIFSAMPSFDQLLWRQWEIESLLSSEVFPELSSFLGEWYLKEPWTRLGKAEDAFIYDIDEEKSYRSQIGYLWAFVRGQSYHDIESDDIRNTGWIHLWHTVHELLTALENDIDAYEKFLHLCKEVPIWRERAVTILELTKKLRPYLSEQSLLGGFTLKELIEIWKKVWKLKLPEKVVKKITSTYCTISELIYILMREGKHFSEFIHLAEMIEREKWAKISFDSQNPFSYVWWRHPSKDYKSQKANPSHTDKQITIYSGANTSWKSWWLQRDLIIRRAVETLWYAPVSKWNFPKRYDMMVFLDRASTNARAKKSAYMEEVSRILKMLEECKEKTCLVYIDEPFSTTAPSDQSWMIEILIEKVLALGGDIVIATHSEDAMNTLSQRYGSKIWFFHYDYQVERDQKGNPSIKTKYKLKSGIADACSLDVAEIDWAPEDMVTLARDYYSGKRWPYHMSKKDFSFPSFDERGTIWELWLQTLFSYSWWDPLFLLYSRDPDFATSPLSARNLRSTEARVSLAELVDMAEVDRLLSMMILRSGSISKEDFQKRQKLFQTLAGNRLFEKILHQVSVVADREEDFRSIGNLRKWGINHALNPINISRDHYFGSLPRLSVNDNRYGTSEINAAIAYLNLHRKLLPSLPPEIVKLLIELRYYKEFILKYSDIKQYAIENTKEKRSFIDAFIDGYEVWFTTEREQFFSDAKSYFLPYVELQNIRMLREYFGWLRERMVNIARYLPIVPYEAFENRWTEELLEEYLSIIEIDLTRWDEKKKYLRWERKALRNGYLSMGLFDGIMKDTSEQTVRSLLAIYQWKRDYQKLITTLKKIDHPFIVSSLQFLETQHSHLINFRVDEDSSESMSKGLSKTWDYNNYQQRSFRYTHSGKEEIRRFVFTAELDRLSALCVYAHDIAHWKLHPVHPNETGSISIPDNQNIFDIQLAPTDLPHKNSFTLDENIPIQILTGPNGSGKTYFAKAWIMSVLQALSTGFTYSQGATVPFFDRIIYFDRVNEQDGIHSSFANELRYWKEIWELVEKWERILIFCDEMFSTVPSKYQSAFSDATLRKLVSNGVYIVTASHHHEWVDSLARDNPNIPIAHLSFEIIEGKPIFSRKLTPWHALSHAREVAKMLGFE